MHAGRCARGVREGWDLLTKSRASVTAEMSGSSRRAVRRAVRSVSTEGRVNKSTLAPNSSLAHSAQFYSAQSNGTRETTSTARARNLRNGKGKS